MSRIALRILAALVGIAATPCAVWLIVLLLREVGPCWELYLAAFALQVGAIKITASCASFALNSEPVA